MKRKSSKNKKPLYLSMQMVRRVRHWLSKDVKKVFDTESDPELMDYEIKDKARISGLSIKRYTEALKKLNSQPTPKLMLTFAQIERDFTSQWYRRMRKAIQWAEEKKDYKAILALEREKTIIMRRLIVTGRVLSPFESEGDEKKEDQGEPYITPDLELYRPEYNETS